MKKITLKSVNEAVELAHKYCCYIQATNETYGPYDVRNLDGPSTSRHYDRRREWDTRIAVALAEEKFNFDLSGYDIANHGPWRDTVRAIHAAVNAELDEQARFESELAESASEGDH